MCYLSVIIPAYNEEKRIVDTLSKIRDYLNKQEFTWEIILVDDGSSDGTVVEAKGIIEESRLSIIVNRDNRGKGYTVKKGILASKGEAILFSDADLSTPIEELKGMLELIKGGWDIVIGSRGLRESKLIKPQPWYRQLMGRLFNLIVRTLILKGFRDTQCGFKCYRREAALAIFPFQRINGFTFDVETLYLASRLGLKINEHPVSWINSPESKVRLFGGSFSMLIELLKIIYYDIIGLYDINELKGHYADIKGKKKQS
jgi:dolichyl-phosphate beta-glucosyltransferase